MTTQTTIRPVNEKDALAITEIYNYYITETTVSFETELLSLESMSQRIRNISKSHPYLVAEEKGRVVGYCYAHPWKERAAYSHTLEVTIYLERHYKGKGLGSRMMRQLITECKKTGEYKNLIACITEENKESLAFHKEMGFEKVSHFRKVGYKFGKWLDVVDMELTLS